MARTGANWAVFLENWRLGDLETCTIGDLVNWTVGEPRLGRKGSRQDLDCSTYVAVSPWRGVKIHLSLGLLQHPQRPSMPCSSEVHLVRVWRVERARNCFLPAILDQSGICIVRELESLRAARTALGPPGGFGAASENFGQFEIGRPAPRGEGAPL